MKIHTRQRNPIVRPVLWVLLLAGAATLVACAGPAPPAPTAAATRPPAERVFATPEEAGVALQVAARAGDPAALLAVLGPDATGLIDSGDPVQDRNAANAFAGAYDVMHRWRPLVDGSQTLVVGADNYPLPIPLRQTAAGQWRFDTAAGKDELLNRRIGRNELAVIEACRAAADAQGDYFRQAHGQGGTHVYAAKFISDTGTEDGLYWPSPEGQAQSPLGPLAANATAEGYQANPQGHMPFHGYYFRMLPGQTDQAPGGAMSYVVNDRMSRGFAFVAYRPSTASRV
jgi:hypothetical protein